MAGGYEEFLGSRGELVVSGYEEWRGERRERTNGDFIAATLAG